MKKFRKNVAFLLGAGVLACAAAGVCLSSRPEVAQAATPTENGPVEVTCKDYFKKDVKITVEYIDGKYYLADFKKNFYVFDTTNYKMGSTLYNDYHYYLHDSTSKQREIGVYSCTDGKFSADPLAVSVFYNISTAYDFYTVENVGQDWKGVNGKNDENRSNGYNSNTELPLYAFVHYNVNLDYQHNASFNRWDESGFIPSVILIGDGSGKTEYWGVHHQGAALDILAHEYQHGITRYKTKKGLNGGESGAINEAVSDIFGMLAWVKAKGLSLDNDSTWKHGTDATVDGRALRDFVNPSSVSTSYKSDYATRSVCTHSGEHTTACDEGYEHYNSTVLTHLQYCIYKNAANKKDFSVESLGKLWMRILELLPEEPNFMDFAQCYVNAAVDTGFSEDAIKTILQTLNENKFEALHKVTFKTEDDRKIGEYYVKNGGTVQAPKSPTLPGDETYRYKFKKWEDGYEEKLKNVTKDVEIVGSFDKVTVHTVTFYDAEGNVLREQTVETGGKVIAPASPQKEKTDHQRFVFEGWDKNFSNVTEDLEVRPKYKTINYYTVTFVDESGNVLKEAQEIDEGMAAVAPDGTPTKAKEAGKRYEFKEWSEPFDNVTKDLTIKPVFDTINVYTVQFVKEDGTVLSSSEVDEGGSVTAPEAPRKEKTAQYTYTFKEWSESFTDIHSDLTIKPVYEETVNKYTVTYFVDGEEKSAELEYGASLDSILPEGMKGWFTDADCSSAFTGTVTGNITVYTEKNSSNVGLFIGIGAGALVVIAGAVLAVVLIKKKKHSQE